MTYLQYIFSFVRV